MKQKLIQVRFLVIFSIICFTLSSCTSIANTIADQMEVCDYNGEVFTALSQNYYQWNEYFAESSLLNNGMTIEIGNNIYVVRSNYQTNEGIPILSTTTWNTHPISLLGNAGYLYVPDDDIAFFRNDLQVQRMTENIYCYFDSEVHNSNL